MWSSAYCSVRERDGVSPVPQKLSHNISEIAEIGQISVPILDFTKPPGDAKGGALISTFAKEGVIPDLAGGINGLESVRLRCNLNAIN